MPENISKRSLNNAAISYWLLFISWLMFFNKSNPDINNKYVKDHIKSSIVLHVLLLLNFLIFIWFWLFHRVSFFSFKLNIIIANILFLIIFALIVKWIFDALNWNTPNIWSAIKMTTGVWLDINNDSIFDEKDKLTILFSYIPFAWYITSSKIENEKIQNILKVNLLATLFISLVYILKYNNVVNLLFLIYIIYIIFCWVYLYTKDSLVTISLPNYLEPKEMLLKIKAFLKYVYYYITWNFENYKTIENELTVIENDKEARWSEKLEKMADIKINKYLIYIPIVNFLFFSQKQTKYTMHIRNWITMSFLFIFVALLILFGTFNVRVIILFLFPICFGIWMLDKLYYRMPFIYDLYVWFIKLKNFIFEWKNKIAEKRKEVKEVNLKVEK